MAFDMIGHAVKKVCLLTCVCDDFSRVSYRLNKQRLAMFKINFWIVEKTLSSKLVLFVILIAVLEFESLILDS